MNEIFFMEKLALCVQILKKKMINYLCLYKSGVRRSRTHFVLMEFQLVIPLNFRCLSYKSVGFFFKFIKFQIISMGKWHADFCFSLKWFFTPDEFSFRRPTQIKRIEYKPQCNFVIMDIWIVHSFFFLNTQTSNYSVPCIFHVQFTAGTIQKSQKKIQ